MEKKIQDKVVQLRQRATSRRRETGHSTASVVVDDAIRDLRRVETGPDPECRRFQLGSPFRRRPADHRYAALGEFPAPQLPADRPARRLDFSSGISRRESLRVPAWIENA